jgi:hypothetical protein
MTDSQNSWIPNGAYDAVESFSRNLITLIAALELFSREYRILSMGKMIVPNSIRRRVTLDVISVNNVRHWVS